MSDGNELAKLQAEVEQEIDMANSLARKLNAAEGEVVKLREELRQADAFGRGEFRVTQHAYDQAVRVMYARGNELDRLRELLRQSARKTVFFRQMWRIGNDKRAELRAGGATLIAVSERMAQENERLRRELDAAESRAREAVRLQTLGGSRPPFNAHTGWDNVDLEQPATASDPAAPPLLTQWGSNAHLRKAER